jgi:outer membrane biosynthesis protein TonB
MFLERLQVPAGRFRAGNEAMWMADEVRIARSTLTLLIATLLLALLALAFLLGRMSAPNAPAAAPTSVPSLAAQPPAPPPVAEANPPRRLEAADPPPPRPAASQAPRPIAAEVQRPPAPQARPRPARPQPAVAPVSTPEPTPVSRPRDQADIKAYFDKIDRVLANTAAMGDANQVATQMLQQSMNGDTSGFDELQSQTRQALSALASIQAPGRCREHHQLLRRQLEQSLALVVELKQASSSLDTSGLQALAGRGQALQAEAERLKALEERLRSEAQ